MTHNIRDRHGRFQKREIRDRNITRRTAIVLTLLSVYASSIISFGVSPTITIERAEARQGEHVEEAEEPALSPQVEHETPVEKAIRLIPHTQDETERRIRYLYERAGEHADVLARIAYCESQWFSIQSGVQQDYGRELSFGIFQLSVLHHNITVEQALDPYFSIDYAIELYEKEGEKPWYGYRNGRCTNGLPEYWL
jgi:hypothetical protein